MKKAKPFEISQKVVVEAWKQVKANQGAAGVDKQTIAKFEKNLKNNLYTIWNRMSSGSYVPPPVRTVSIPKRKAASACSGFPLFSTEWPRRSGNANLSRWWSRIFRRTPTATGWVISARCGGGHAGTMWKYDWVLEFDIKGLLETSSYCTPSHDRLSKRWC